MSTVRVLSLEEALAEIQEKRLVLDMADVDDNDQHKRYKLRVVEKLKREGNVRVLKEVLQHIKRSTTTPAWFEYILPKEEKVPVDESENKLLIKSTFYVLVVTILQTTTMI